MKCTASPTTQIVITHTQYCALSAPLQACNLNCIVAHHQVFPHFVPLLSAGLSIRIIFERNVGDVIQNCTAVLMSLSSSRLLTSDSDSDCILDLNTVSAMTTAFEPSTSSGIGFTHYNGTCRALLHLEHMFAFLYIIAY